MEKMFELRLLEALHKSETALKTTKALVEFILDELSENDSNKRKILRAKLKVILKKQETDISDNNNIMS